MRIAIVGCGGVGGYLAGLAVEAGHEVATLCRGQTARALTRHGLRLIDTNGERSVPVDVFEEISAIPRTDLILLCVKAWQVADFAPRLASLMTERTLVVTVQNGIEASALVAETVGERHVLAGALMVIAEQVVPGVFRRMGDLMGLELGPIGPALTVDQPEVQQAAAMLGGLGIRVSLSADARRLLWRKLVFASAISGVPTMYGVTAGDATDDPEVDAAVRSAIREGVAVAAAEGIVFSETEIADLICDYEQLPTGMTSSMQGDIQAGRPSELSSLNGMVMRKGLRHGVPTAMHNKVFRELSSMSLI